jgi:hypothetical protein
LPYDRYREGGPIVPSVSAPAKYVRMLWNIYWKISENSHWALVGQYVLMLASLDIEVTEDYDFAC